jgi:hypothetical protein
MVSGTKTALSVRFLLASSIVVVFTAHQALAQQPTTTAAPAPVTTPAGTFVIAPEFDAADTFIDGLALVKKNGKWGYIDKTGTVVIAPQFDQVVGALGFPEGLAPVKKGGKWGYIAK